MSQPFDFDKALAVPSLHIAQPQIVVWSLSRITGGAIPAVQRRRQRTDILHAHPAHHKPGIEVDPSHGHTGGRNAVT
ncbi:hypothetical protein AU490_01705 [Lonsdalea populi]|nr:hypothetical protein AU508_02875 [Lonsdalea populi]RAT13784.1 hypothetical protein AU486_14085 [Lonsdalea quercina]RAT30322.1 hypothetical protein AU490_01705 [Lonsdalea populi]RAT31643.1 hypothetical protein AU491_13855 [Lonsdalea populi]RAT41628.1 hypothetical protein AU496_14755 [Lonsdalea populi]